MQASGTSPADALAEELTAATSLLNVLEQEQACLVQGDVDGVSRLTGEKTSLVTRMTDLARRRHRTLGANGFSADEAGMQDWLGSGSADDAACWSALLDTARKARELNRTNGLLISQQMTRNQLALNILQGSQQGGSIYGPNGQAASKTSSRRLVVG